MVEESGHGAAGDVGAEQKRRADLENEISECMTSYWAATVGGLALGVAAGLRRKTYVPMAVAGMGGVAWDWERASRECKYLQDQLDKLGAATAQQAAGK